jgi:hypothetical protein
MFRRTALSMSEGAAGRCLTRLRYGDGEGAARLQELGIEHFLFIIIWL